MPATQRTFTQASSLSASTCLQVRRTNRPHSRHRNLGSTHMDQAPDNILASHHLRTRRRVVMAGRAYHPRSPETRINSSSSSSKLPLMSHRGCSRLSIPTRRLPRTAEAHTTSTPLTPFSPRHHRLPVPRQMPMPRRTPISHSRCSSSRVPARLIPNRHRCKSMVSPFSRHNPLNL